LKRLQEKRSVYDVQKWEAERKRVEKIIQMRTKFNPSMLQEKTITTKKEQNLVYESRFFEDYELEKFRDQRNFSHRRSRKSSPEKSQFESTLIHRSQINPHRSQGRRQGALSKQESFRRVNDPVLSASL